MTLLLAAAGPVAATGPQPQRTTTPQSFVSPPRAAVDKNGETAMHGAAYKHVPSVVQFLIDKGAKIEIWNRQNKKGWTPLKIAEGIQRGMNIVGHPPSVVAIRKAMDAAD